jgi:hypothetical protein
MPFIKLHVDTYRLLSQFSDHEFCLLLINAVEKGETAFTYKSQHDAQRNFVIPPELATRWDLCRLNLPRGWTMGDVADRLCDAPKIDESLKRKTLIVRVPGEAIVRLKDLWHQKCISSETVFRRALEIATEPDTPEYEGRLYGAPFTIRMDLAHLKSPFQDRKFAEGVMQALDFFEGLPRQDRSENWQRVSLQRQTVETLRYLTHLLEQRKEDVVLLGLEAVSDPPRVYGRSQTTHFQWSGEQLQRLVDSGLRPSSAITQAVELLAAGREKEFQKVSHFRRCWPFGAGRANKAQ